MIQRVVTLSLLLVISAGLAPAFQTSAYIPYYRIDAASGGENRLSRPSWDTAPDAWDGRIISDKTQRELAKHWTEGRWSTRLRRDYDAFYLHVPLNDDFIRGRLPTQGQWAYLRSLAAADGSRIGLSLLGHSQEYLPIAENQEALEEFVAYLSGLAAVHGLDSVDLDWEFLSAPRQAERIGITILAETLKSEMPSNSRITAALSRWRLPDMEFFTVIDGVNLMAYDGYGKHATYDSAVADAELVISRTQIDPEKLHLGIPFYGRIFDPDSEDYWKETKNYRVILADHEPTADDDEAGGYFYNGPSTVERKTRWAREKGLGGVFVWEPFYDTTGEMSLSAAINKTLSE